MRGCARNQVASPADASAAFKLSRHGHERLGWARFLLLATGTAEAGVNSMARYGKKAQSKVKLALHERKSGTLRSGRSGRKVTSRKQAIAIGLAEARRAGAKVPRKQSSRKKK